MENKQTKKWKNEEYEILQIMPANGVRCVYAMDDENRPGEFKLESWPVDLLALAKKTTSYFGPPSMSASPWKEYEERDVENVVVGLLLSMGEYSICNEDHNFSGYCNLGDDINDAIAYLAHGRFPGIRLSQ